MDFYYEMSRLKLVFMLQYEAKFIEEKEEPQKTDFKIGRHPRN